MSNRHTKLNKSKSGLQIPFLLLSVHTNSGLPIPQTKTLEAPLAFPFCSPLQSFIDRWLVLHLKNKQNVTVTSVPHCPHTAQTTAPSAWVLNPLAPLYSHRLSPTYSCYSTYLLWHFYLTFEKCFRHSYRIKWLRTQGHHGCISSASQLGLWGQAVFWWELTCSAGLQSNILNDICSTKWEDVPFLDWLICWEAKLLLEPIFIYLRLSWVRCRR